MSALTLTRHTDGVRFSVHVQPRASRSEVRGVHNGALRVRLQAPPVDGAANAELVELLASSLGVPRRSVRVIAGEAARWKIVDVEGVVPDHVERLTSGRA
ncbi:MAG: DUF167 domain-containing protein [Gemmatimonadaceae bacterium]